MTPLPVSSTFPRSTYLCRVLQADGLVSGVSGLALLLAPDSIGAFLGWPAPLAIALVGAGLLRYSASLFFFAAREPRQRPGAWLAVVLNVLWVMSTAFVLVAGWPPGLSLAGKWALLVVADAVAAFALLQAYGLWRPGRAA